MRKQIEGFRPDCYISSMLYSRDTPFWSGTLEINVSTQFHPSVTLCCLHAKEASHPQYTTHLSVCLTVSPYTEPYPDPMTRGSEPKPCNHRIMKQHDLAAGRQGDWQGDLRRSRSISPAVDRHPMPSLSIRRDACWFCADI